jgi:hypothetical protein
LSKYTRPREVASLVLVVALLSNDGTILVYKVDTLGIAKIATGQVGIEAVTPDSRYSIVDLTITINAGKINLGLFQKIGVFKFYEIN